MQQETMECSRTFTEEDFPPLEDPDPDPPLDPFESRTNKGTLKECMVRRTRALRIHEPSTMALQHLFHSWILRN